MEIAIYLLMAVILTSVSILNVISNIKKEKRRLDLSFEEAMSTLLLIIKYELDVYDRDIFNELKELTSTTHEKYYQDITSKINSNISSELEEEFSRYTTRLYPYRVIAREVKIYLTSKIEESMV